MRNTDLGSLFFSVLYLYYLLANENVILSIILLTVFLDLMQSARYDVQMPNGVILAGNFYENQASRAGIIIFPGFSEHRTSQSEMARKLQEEFSVWIFDANGQGESTGRWYIPEMISSIAYLANQLGKKHDLSIGAMGNSVGGIAVGLAAADGASLDSLCLTSTPAGLQDVVSKRDMYILENLPQSLLRAYTIGFDMFHAAINPEYRALTHAQFKTPNGYKSHAQMGALRIPDAKELLKNIIEAPRLDKKIHQIKQPILFVYGGQDQVIGLNEGFTEELAIMMLRAEDVDLELVRGADHSLNKKTPTDSRFNHSPEFQYIKEKILEHFQRTMF